MITGANRRLSSACLLAVAAVVTAFLASGCLWGVVRDAETGAPVGGATVELLSETWCDELTTTDATGVYAFDFHSPLGAVDCRSYRLNVSARGHLPNSTWVYPDYADNPYASLDNPLSFWEVQNFELSRALSGVEVRLTSVDISRTRLSPPGDDSETTYRVRLGVFDRENERIGCHATSDLIDITSTNPPPQDLALGCWAPTVAGREIGVEVEVEVNVYPPDEDDHISVARFEWTALDSVTDWVRLTLDSAAPGDWRANHNDSNLEFTAQLQYRSVPD